ncbi:MAG: hypothetical protein LQ340_000756 [Diploschistes diacapsis]|nr:MAG: hypothetical protein LQ340_000756 [Diploschistes diacapsis]
MFAVPGWSVSADKLKRQEASPQEGQNKKRKRNNRSAEERSVDSANVAELWEQHVEGRGKKRKPRGAPPKTGTKTKALRRDDGAEDAYQRQKLNGGVDDHATPDQPRQDPQRGSEVQNRKNRKQKGDTGNKHESMQLSQGDESAMSLIADLPEISPDSKLTPLQAKMRQKLISSRFRYLNETLYTTSSVSSHELFKQNPSFFSEYHEGFRRQVSSWPENPLDGFARWLLERGERRGGREDGRGAMNTDKRHKNKRGQNDQRLSSDPRLSGPDPKSSNTLDPLPRTGFRPSTCTIVDLGCGEAKLAQRLQVSAAKLKLVITSYDLAAPNSFVTVADIRSLPLADASVDVAIFCLALMGTNWIEFIEEAYRVLKWKGECWIAEVASRFGAPKRGGRVDHSVGNRVKDQGGKKGKGKKGPKEEDGAQGEEELGLAEEVTATPQASTDVSAFVAVLRRRGFVLQGEPDVGNKMFVRMRFLKALPAARGKCVKTDGGQEKRPKFIDDEGGQITAEEEGRVLKPCVYKTR